MKFVGYILFVLFLLAGILFSAVTFGNAQDLDVNYAFTGKDNESADSIRQIVGLRGEDPRLIVTDIINVILGFLGTVALLIVLYGGFLWMTALGNDDKVSQAKKLLAAGFIGLVIVLAAFSLTIFIMNSLLKATGVSG